MEAALEKMALNLALPFILRQIDKFQGQINWDQIEKDLESKMKGHVPSWLESSVIEVVKFIVIAVKNSLSQADALNKIIQLLAAKDLPGALMELKVLVLSSVKIDQSLAASDVDKVKELFSC